jgi:hypothetical protein
MADARNTRAGEAQKSDAAKNVGQRTAECAGQNKDWAGQQNSGNKQQGMGGSNAANIREHMNVIASCGTRVGVVDHVEGDTIKLTKNDSLDGHHHFIPMGWVERVDDSVHLRKNSQETEQGWKTEAAGCGSCGM